MKIVYNPHYKSKPAGSLIHGWNFGSKLYDDHLPGQVKQYPDNVADALVDNFGFLQIVTSKQAEELVKKPQEYKFNCSYCEFGSDGVKELNDHVRTGHADRAEEAAKPVIDPAVVPLADGQDLGGRAYSNQGFDRHADIPNGVDGDGVQWYGGGRQEVNRSSMRAVNPYGEGHFGSHI